MTSSFALKSSIWAENSSMTASCSLAGNLLKRFLNVIKLEGSGQWQTFAATANLFGRHSVTVCLGIMKKTGRLALRLEPEWLRQLQFVAKKEERSVASQALRYIKEGLDRDAQMKPEMPRGGFGFAAEPETSYKINHPKK